jgi:hypothetical protein
MEQVQSRIPDLENEDAIVLVCQSGQRARMVAGLLEPCGKELSILEGGTSAWVKAGLPVVSTSVTRWSLERQVRFAAGLLRAYRHCPCANYKHLLDIPFRLCGAWTYFPASAAFAQWGAAGLDAMESRGSLQL